MSRYAGLQQIAASRWPNIIQHLSGKDYPLLVESSWGLRFPVALALPRSACMLLVAEERGAVSTGVTSALIDLAGMCKSARVFFLTCSFRSVSIGSFQMLAFARLMGTHVHGPQNEQQ